MGFDNIRMSVPIESYSKCRDEIRSEIEKMKVDAYNYPIKNIISVSEKLDNKLL